MAKHLRIVKGNLVGPNGQVLKPGDKFWVQGKLISNPDQVTLESWDRSISWPGGAVNETVYTGGKAYSPHDCFLTKDDATTPVRIANDAEVCLGDSVWIYVRGYRGMVEKRVVNYDADCILLCYPDVYSKVKDKTGGKGNFVTYHDPEDVYASKEEIIKAKNLVGMSSAPLRAVHKVVQRPS